MGWLVRETNTYLKVVWDRAVRKAAHEREDPASGLVVNKADIIEVRDLG